MSYPPNKPQGALPPLTYINISSAKDDVSRSGKQRISMYMKAEHIAQLHAELTLKLNAPDGAVLVFERGKSGAQKYESSSLYLRDKLAQRPQQGPSQYVPRAQPITPVQPYANPAYAPVAPVQPGLRTAGPQQQHGAWQGQQQAAPAQQPLPNNNGWQPPEYE